MSERQTLNVSLSSDQERFIRALVATGRYQTASEVVRDGLRLLEEEQHQRLLETWLYEGLSDAEKALLPADTLDRARAAVRKFIEDGRRSGDTHGWVSREDVMKHLAKRQRTRKEAES